MNELLNADAPKNVDLQVNQRQERDHTTGLAKHNKDDRGFFFTVCLVFSLL